ncbi:MAG: hypothetical protein V1754_12175, partial [Pseudomonadota bacterium]
MANFLLAQIDLRIEQKTEWPNLDVQFHVHIPVAPRLPIFGAFVVVVVIIHRLLSTTIRNAHRVGACGVR